MIFDLESHTIEIIQQKDAWRICDFVVSNSDRLKKYLPKTLEQNLNPTLSDIFVAKKVAAFYDKKEFLFTLKEKENRTIIGLIYLKKLDWHQKQGELAYCIGYQFEGKGITSNSVQTICKWAFEDLKLQTLQIIAHKTNLGSIGIAEKCGFNWKNTLPSHYTPSNEKPLDMELFELYHER